MTRRDGHDQDVDHELEFHLEMLTRRYVDDGLTREAARAKALARMGDLDAAVRERHAVLTEMTVTNNRSRWIQALAHDLRHAAKRLKRSPGYVAITVLMLALGTGASTAVFSVVDGVILRSPFSGADSMALLHVMTPEGRKHSGVPRDAYDRIVAAAPSPIAAVGLVTVGAPIVTRVDTPRRTQAECVSASMADVVGTRPIMGRWFGAEDDHPGAAPVTVVSAAFWRRTLGGDPQVIGRVIALDDEPVTIIGVMPAGFEGPLTRLNRDLWLPLGLSAQDRPRFGCIIRDSVNAAVRLSPGAPMEAGTAALNLAAGTDDLVLTPVRDAVTSDLRGPFAALIGAVLAVLLIAVANVTNLGLERLTGRQRELAVQLALGATRGRLIRQTVAEHVIVAAAGAVIGATVAALTLDALVAWLPAALPNLATVAINGTVLAASLILTLTGGVASGIVASWQTSAAVKGGLLVSDRGYSPGALRTRQAVVAGELALGVLLMVGALLMVRTFLTLSPREPGFDPTNKHLALVRLPSMTAGDQVRFIDAVRSELRAVPGVRAVAATTYIPMSRSVAGLEVTVGEVKGLVYTGAVTEDYFEVLRIPLRGGRGFLPGDSAEGAPVAVVNEAFVRRYSPERTPLGTTVTLEDGYAGGPIRIVGIIGDTRSATSDTRARPELYMPFGQLRVGSPYFVVDAGPHAAAGLPPIIRQVVFRNRPGQLVDRIEGYEAFLGTEMARPRLGAWLFSAFAALAVLLAAVGLAATLAWSVAQRRREIGIRMALGAQPGDVRNLVVQQTFWMSAMGVGVGLLAAAATTNLLEGWLYGVTPLDPLTFAACGALMLTISALAAYVPTRRATRINPIIALRGD